MNSYLTYDFLEMLNFQRYDFCLIFLLIISNVVPLWSEHVSYVSNPSRLKFGESGFTAQYVVSFVKVLIALEQMSVLQFTR